MPHPKSLVSLLLLLSVIGLVLVVEGFPSPTNGPCPSFPRAQALDPHNLPPSIIDALQKIDLGITSARMVAGTPAVSVALLSDQSVIWYKGYGLANATSGSKVTMDTIFRIGSISKLFTAVSLMMARDAGQLHLDDEVNRYEPLYNPKNPFPSRRSTTFHQLATHLAGLPREGPCFLPCNFTSQEIYPLINQLSLVLPPNTRAAYSNLGFAILGNVLAERVMKSSFDEMMMKQIIGPMKMRGTAPNLAGVDRSQLAVPYADPNTVCPDNVCLADFGWVNPAGGLFSSTRDMASLVSLFMRTDKPANIQEGQILDGATIREMTLQRYLSNSKDSGFSNILFELLYFDGYPIQSKGGDVNGYSAMIAFVSNLKMGVVILTNVNEHAEIYAPIIASILIPALEGLYRAMEKPGELPLPASAFVGRYVSSVEPITIFATSDNEIALEDGGTIVGLEWIGNLTFIIRQPENSQASCFITEVGYDFNYVYFQQQGSNIVSFTIPGRDWGIVWKKE